MEAYMADKYFDNEKSCINLENDCNTDTISILMKENLLICHKIRKVSCKRRQKYKMVNFLW
jgi:phosphoribosyl-AMP cyclohydrolase